MSEEGGEGEGGGGGLEKLPSVDHGRHTDRGRDKKERSSSIVSSPTVVLIKYSYFDTLTARWMAGRLTVILRLTQPG